MMFPHRWESNFADLDAYTIVAKKYYKKSRDWSIFWENKKKYLKMWNVYWTVIKKKIK